MAKVTIIGASKGIGLETTKKALAEGHHVNAFARSATDITIKSDKLIKSNGDALLSTDVEAAVADADVVIQTLGVPFNTRLLTGPIRLFSSATRILLPAMKHAGVKRLIAVTGYGAGDSRETISVLQRLPFNLVFGRAYKDKSIQEEMIKASNLDWIIARPGILTNGRASDRYDAITDPVNMQNGIISRANVAQFLVSQIQDDTYLRTAPVLRGQLF